VRTTRRSRCTGLILHAAALTVLGAVPFGPGGGPGPRAAEPAVAAADGAAPAPEQVRALIGLLGDPQLRDWLREQLAEPGPPAVGSAAPIEMGTMGLAERRLESIRSQLRAMAAAVPRLPSALTAAWGTLERDLSETGILWALLLIGAFAGLGFGAQWLYWALTGAALRHIVALPMATVPDRAWRH
jgi:moderate conductance mechanosensitive channel